MRGEQIGGTLLNLELLARRTVRSVIFVGIVRRQMEAKAYHYGILNDVRFEHEDAGFVIGALRRVAHASVDT